MGTQDWLGLEATDDASRWRFALDPRVLTPAGALHGGAALAAVVDAAERVTARPLVWATAQYLRARGPGRCRRRRSPRRARRSSHVAGAYDDGRRRCRGALGVHGPRAARVRTQRRVGSPARRAAPGRVRCLADAGRRAVGPRPLRRAAGLGALRRRGRRHARDRPDRAVVPVPRHATRGRRARRRGAGRLRDACPLGRTGRADHREQPRQHDPDRGAPDDGMGARRRVGRRRGRRLRPRARPSLGGGRHARRAHVADARPAATRVPTDGRDVAAAGSWARPRSDLRVAPQVVPDARPDAIPPTSRPRGIVPYKRGTASTSSSACRRLPSRLAYMASTVHPCIRCSVRPSIRST